MYDRMNEWIFVVFILSYRDLRDLSCYACEMASLSRNDLGKSQKLLEVCLCIESIYPNISHHKHVRGFLFFFKENNE